MLLEYNGRKVRLTKREAELVREALRPGGQLLCGRCKVEPCRFECFCALAKLARLHGLGEVGDGS